MTRVKTNQTAPATTSGHKLKCDYRDDDFEYWPRPTELELARLAAQLARTEKIDPRQLVQEAWELFRESCHTIQKDYRELKEYFEQEAKADDQLDWQDDERVEALPAPKKYPVMHKQVESLLLPKLKGRTAERASLIREYLFFQLVRTCFVWRPKLAALSYWEMEADLLEQLRQNLKDDVDRHFEKFRKTVFDADTYTRFAGPFLEWHRRYLAAKKAAAARKRWAKPGDASTEVATEPSPKLPALKKSAKSSWTHSGRQKR